MDPQITNLVFHSHTYDRRIKSKLNVKELLLTTIRKNTE